MTDDSPFRRLSPSEVLSKISAVRLPRPEMGVPYNPPKTPMEKLVVTYCEEVMGLEAVGVDDNFFALGGDSLQMTRVMSRIREKLGVELTFDDFFSSDSIAVLAAALEGRQKSSDNGGIPGA